MANRGVVPRPPRAGGRAAPAQQACLEARFTEAVPENRKGALPRISFGGKLRSQSNMMGGLTPTGGLTPRGARLPFTDA